VSSSYIKILIAVFSRETSTCIVVDPFQIILSSLCGQICASKLYSEIKSLLENHLKRGVMLFIRFSFKLCALLQADLAVPLELCVHAKGK